MTLSLTLLTWRLHWPIASHSAEAIVRGTSLKTVLVLIVLNMATAVDPATESSKVVEDIIADDTKSASTLQEKGDEQEQNTTKPSTQEDIDKDSIHISAEEQDVLNQIQNEKESVTKSIDTMVSTLNNLETDCQQKTDTINETFDALIQSLKDRQFAVINNLNTDVLSTKTDALKQMESLKQYQQKLAELDSKYHSLINPKTQNPEV